VLVPPSEFTRSNVIKRRGHIAILCMAALSFSVAFAQAQEPAPTPSASSPTSTPPASTPGKPGKKKYSHANDFLIRGTVFTDKALSFPGVQLRIRKAGEKKFRWESYTNSRGEFAVRVPQGSDYEMVVRAKGFAEQTRTIDAKSGGNEESMVFRMLPAAGGKG
jgi:Carboxypeptidase regulatory-like domain